MKFSPCGFRGSHEEFRPTPTWLEVVEGDQTRSHPSRGDTKKTQKKQMYVKKYYILAPYISPMHQSLHTSVPIYVNIYIYYILYYILYYHCLICLLFLRVVQQQRLTWICWFRFLSLIYIMRSWDGFMSYYICTYNPNICISTSSLLICCHFPPPTHCSPAERTPWVITYLRGSFFFRWKRMDVPYLIYLYISVAERCSYSSSCPVTCVVVDWAIMLTLYRIMSRSPYFTTSRRYQTTCSVSSDIVSRFPSHSCRIHSRRTSLSLFHGVDTVK